MGIKEVYNLTRQIPLDLGLKNNPLWLHVLLSRPTGVVVLPSRATVAVGPCPFGHGLQPCPRGLCWGYSSPLPAESKEAALSSETEEDMAFPGGLCALGLWWNWQPC